MSNQNQEKLIALCLTLHSDGADFSWPETLNDERRSRIIAYMDELKKFGLECLRKHVRVSDLIQDDTFSLNHVKLEAEKDAIGQGSENPLDGELAILDKRSPKFAEWVSNCNIEHTTTESARRLMTAALLEQGDVNG